MPAKTHIPGKDAALEDTIGQAAGLLRSHGLGVEAASWLNPVPNCWSVHLRSTRCPQIYTNGKGASKMACEASALGEFFERLSTNYFFSDHYLGAATADAPFVYYPDERWFPVVDQHIAPGPGGEELLTGELMGFYDPDGELAVDLLRDNNCDNAGRGVCALPFTHTGSGRVVYFPVSVLNNLYVSNGMSAGNTATECRAQALSEILERHVKNRVISSGLCLPDVPPEVMEGYPSVAEAIASLEKSGFPVRVKDASLGGRFPVICVLLFNPHNGGCYAAFGASCRFEVALERTVTEMLQGRDLDQLDVFEPPSHDLQLVADQLNLESHFIDSNGLLAWSMLGDHSEQAFCHWDFGGTTLQEHRRLEAIIAGCGHEIYVAEYSHCGMNACRVIVPGMSEIYPVDDLIWNNKTMGAGLRPELLRLGQMSCGELRQFFATLDDLGLDDRQRIADVIGVVFDEGTAWEGLRVGELKAMLALATGDLDLAARWCAWCRQGFGGLPPGRLKLYRALHDLLALQQAGEAPADYALALDQYYEAELLTTARQLIKGHQTFPGLVFCDTWEETSPAHGKLVELYWRLHPLKEGAP